MTDELTPEQEADISRLLAEARHDEPIPADVAARLDAVLGDLSADDLEVFETGASVSTVAELDGARRRRRNAGRLLLAAAAVVVGGVAVGQNIGSMSGDDMADSAAEAGSADAPRANDAADGDDAGGEGLGTSGVDEEGAPAPSESFGYLTDELGNPLAFTSSNFETEVRDRLTSPAKVRREAAFLSLDTVKSYAAEELWTCPDGDYGDGARIPAYYDDQEAVLVLRRPTAGIQRVELLECGTADLLASVDLPAR